MSELVYRLGDKHFGPNGTKYDFAIVLNKASLDQRIKDGWFNTLEEALNPDDSIGDEAPTRNEVKMKADELGLKYPKNIKTSKLQKIVEDEIDKLENEHVLY